MLLYCISNTKLGRGIPLNIIENITRGPVLLYRESRKTNTTPSSFCVNEKQYCEITSVMFRLRTYVHAITTSASRVDMFAVCNEMTITTSVIQDFVTVTSVPGVAAYTFRPNFASSQTFLVLFSIPHLCFQYVH
jgi:hypothetical protein